jgi:hypothetical protein
MAGGPLDRLPSGLTQSGATTDNPIEGKSFRSERFHSSLAGRMKKFSDKQSLKEKGSTKTEKVSRRKLMTLANAKACAKSIKDETSKKILKTFEENEIKLSPGADVFHDGMKKVNLVGALSRLPESISSQYQYELQGKRFKAWKRGLKLSIAASKEKCKRHRNNWCKIPEFLITRSDDEHLRSSNIEKKQYLQLPKFYIGERVGPIYAIDSWENRKPSDEDYGSFAKSFGPIDNPGVELLPKEWIPSKEDLTSYFDNYTKAASFCNRDPIGALTRASFRTINSIFSVDIEPIKPYRYTPISYGNETFDFGIEFNGIYFSVSGKEAAEALLICTTDVEWRGLMYRRALYHEVNENIPIEFDLSVIRTLMARKPKENIIEECRKPDALSEKILQDLRDSVKLIFPPILEEKEETGRPVLEEDQESSDSELEDSSSDTSEVELDLDRKLLQNFYKIYSEEKSSELNDDLNKCLDMSECIQEKFSDYLSYQEEMIRQLEKEEPDYQVYPKVASYYFFMINIFKDYSKRSLINLLTFLCDRFMIPKSRVRDLDKEIEVEPESYFVESENISIFQVEALSVIKSYSEDILSEIGESPLDIEEIIELGDFKDTLEIFESSIENFEIPEEKDVESLFNIDIDIDQIMFSKQEVLEDKSRFMTRLSWIVQSVRGIG